MESVGGNPTSMPGKRKEYREKQIRDRKLQDAKVLRTRKDQTRRAPKDWKGQVGDE